MKTLEKILVYLDDDDVVVIDSDPSAHVSHIIPPITSNAYVGTSLAPRLRNNQGEAWLGATMAQVAGTPPSPPSPVHDCYSTPHFIIFALIFSLSLPSRNSDRSGATKKSRPFSPPLSRYSSSCLAFLSPEMLYFGPSFPSFPRVEVRGREKAFCLWRPLNEDLCSKTPPPLEGVDKLSIR